MVCWRINLSAYPLLTTYNYHHRWPWLLCRWGPVCWCLPIWYQRMRWVVNRKTSWDSIPYKSKCFFAGFMNCVASKCSPHFSIWCPGSLLPSSWDLHDGNLSPMFLLQRVMRNILSQYKYHQFLIETCHNIKQIIIRCFYTDLYCHPSFRVPNLSVKRSHEPFSSLVG